MKKVIVVGMMKNHEENVVNPIIDALKYLKADVERVGGISDFFEPQYQGEVFEDYSETAKFIQKAAKLDPNLTVFFVDFWNYSAPLLVNLPKTVRMTALCHGSTVFPDDVAFALRASPEYEKFLLNVYDVVYVHAPWLIQKISHETPINNCKIMPLPFSVQLKRIRPLTPWKRRIVFAHRWNEDKGIELFLRFMTENPRYEYIICDSAALGDVVQTEKVKVIGWQPQYRLEQLCREGGYAWSSAKSEIAAYAVHDLVSYGLQPLLNTHEAYGDFPRRFIYHSLEHAQQIVEDPFVMLNSEWEAMMFKHRHNAANIARGILDL